MRVVVDSPTESTRVLISKRTDTGDSYPSLCQTEDRKILITAHTEPRLEGVKVWFCGRDPDDRSPYELDDVGDDNEPFLPLVSPNNRGVITPEQLGGQSGPDTHGFTNANGEVQATLEITDRYAGNNYVVLTHAITTLPTSSPVDSIPSYARTGELVAWKRVYIETDCMFRAGADMVQDFVPDSDDQPDTLPVEDASLFASRPWVIVFDAAHPNGEIAKVEATDETANTITLDRDLNNSYKAGYPQLINGLVQYGDAKGAAVGICSGSTGVLEQDLFVPLLDRVKNAFGDADNHIQGNDGGAFIEFRPESDGSGHVPYQEYLDGPNHAVSPDSNPDTTPDTWQYRYVWFKHRLEYDNYLNLWGANKNSDHSWGCSDPVIFVGEIEESDILVSNSELCPIVNADTVAHEFGHRFLIEKTDDRHPKNVWCHLGPNTDYCLMSYDYMQNLEDSFIYSEFCTGSRSIVGCDHLQEARQSTDPLR